MGDLPKVVLNEAPLKELQRKVERLLHTIPREKRVELTRPLLSYEQRVKLGKEECRNHAEVLVAGALVNRNRWTTVAKRLTKFRKRYPSVRTVRGLNELLKNLDDRGICSEVLGWAYSKKHYRHKMLRGLSQAFVRYQEHEESKLGRKLTDFELFRIWARQEDPSAPLKNIKGVGPKLVDWMKMYYGDVQTVPEDVWTKRGLKALGFEDLEDLALFVAKLFSLTPHTLDKTFRFGRYS